MLKETGERQVKPEFINVDRDHRMRYEFAASLITRGANVADIGCGIGYGSYFLAMATDCSSVIGIDISEEAISYANQYYSHPNVNYRCINILEHDVNEKYEIITMFEVIEHIEQPLLFLKKATSILKNNGIIVLTTPNEDVLHFSKEEFKFHHRHYTQDELLELLQAANLKVIFSGSQNGDNVYAFPGNAFNMVVCCKDTSDVSLQENTAIKDTPFNRIMAGYERVNWVLSHAPHKDTRDLIYLLSKLDREAGMAKDQMMSRMDSYRRCFHPQELQDNPNFSGTLGKLQKGTKICQSFHCIIDGLSGISLLPGIYGMNFNGLVTISLYDAHDKLRALNCFTHLEDNQPICIKIPTIVDSAGCIFYLVIEVLDLSESASFTLYCDNLKGNSKLFLDGQEVDLTLTYRTYFI